LFLHKCLWLQPKHYKQNSSGKIEIDGNLNELIWQPAAVAADFIMFEPDNGSNSENKRTEVKVLYDNDAIY
jgi:hypothetical protein